MSPDVEMNTFETIRRAFEEMSQRDIVIAPWLVVNHKNRLSSQVRADLEQAAYELTMTYPDSEILWWHGFSVSPEFRRQAYQETLLSTAAYLSHMRLGTLVITGEMLSVSISLLRNYLRLDGGSSLLSVYSRIVLYLNGQLLTYYGHVSEEIFVSGGWHRPGMDYTLRHELEFGLRHGLYQQISEGEDSIVELTDAGRNLYAACQQDLDRCGYLRQREQLIRAANFTNMEDYEPIMEKTLPQIHTMRKELIQASGIRPGMNVLELGCGTGALTLDDGLYEAVGPSGTVVATDPSVGMLARAKMKLSRLSDAPVQFRQAVAEHIPYPDNTFDAVIGMLFLQFTDIAQAFAEIRRVLKPGGTFTTAYVLAFQEHEEFFVEWFEPVFKRGLAAGGQGALPSREVVPELAGSYFEKFRVEPLTVVLDWHYVDDVVKFLVQAGTMAELNDLPWEARSNLFQDLIARGYLVEQKYGVDGLKRTQHLQWFRGTVEK